MEIQGLKHLEQIIDIYYTQPLHAIGKYGISSAKYWLIREKCTRHVHKDLQVLTLTVSVISWSIIVVMLDVLARTCAFVFRQLYGLSTN